MYFMNIHFILILNFLCTFSFAQNDSKPSISVDLSENEEETGFVSAEPVSNVNSCLTYLQTLGECKLITQCASLRKVRDFSILRRSLCGFIGNEPKLCCPLATNTASTKPQPSIRPTSSTTTSTTTARPPTISSTARPRVVNGNLDLVLPKQLPNVCGLTNSENTRIVGGSPANPGAWPWMSALMVGVQGDRDAKCGSAIISPDLIITAAHCVVDDDGTTKPAAHFSVRLGEHDIDNDSTDDAAIEVDVVQVIAHEEFDLKTFKNDIALLRLSRKVQFNNRISPICLPYDSVMFRTQNIVGRTALITGWGRTAYQGVSSSILLQASLKIVSQASCKQAFKRWVNITDVYMCAATEGFDKDACQGDSGGPMVMYENTNKRWYLMGVVSFGRRCAAPNTPGVYTRIPLFLDWIRDHL